MKKSELRNIIKEEIKAHREGLKESVNEAKELNFEQEWNTLSTHIQHDLLKDIRDKKIADKFAGDFWENLPHFIQRDLKKELTKIMSESIVSEAKEIELGGIKAERIEKSGIGGWKLTVSSSLGRGTQVIMIPDSTGTELFQFLHKNT